MKKLLGILFLSLFLFSFNCYSDGKIINESITFKPFKCEQIKSEFIRTKSENNCLILQKLENHYEVRSNAEWTVICSRYSKSSRGPHWATCDGGFQ